MKDRERIVAAVGVTFNDHDGTSRAFVSAVFSRGEAGKLELELQPFSGVVQGDGAG